MEDSAGLVISSGAIGAICTLGATWLKAKLGEKRRRPLDSDDLFVTHGQCKALRCALEKRIDEIGPALNRIFQKLSENDQRSEDRANQLHRRMDPLIEKIAATSAEVDVMKSSRPSAFK